MHPQANTAVQAPVTPRRRTFLSYAQMDLWLHGVSAEIRAEGFDGLVAIARGGVIPATMLSFHTGLPVYQVRFDRPSQTAHWIVEPPLNARRLLVVEDVAGMGQTLVTVLNLVSRRARCEVLTLASDELSRVKPRWSQDFGDRQAVFPWERHVGVPSHQADWHGGGATGQRILRADHDYRLVAVDLDGVLCQDMPKPMYVPELLDHCLRLRDNLPPAGNIPAMAPHTHVIVTGRPAGDAGRTRAWLAEHGFGDYAVHFRDEGRYGESLPEMARHKAETADAMGASEFIESEAEQAVMIARAAPHLRVYWWNGGEPQELAVAS